MKKIRIYVSCILITIFLLAFSFVNIPLAVDPLPSTWGEQLLTDWTSTRHYGFPDAEKLSNGDILVVFRNASVHGNGGDIETVTSSDDGVTWVHTVVATGASALDPHLCVSSNDTVILAYANTSEGSYHSDAEWYVSYDNASTWKYKGKISNDNIYAVTDMKLVGTTVYLCGWANPSSGNYNCSFWKSTDNGTSWQVIAWLEHASADTEWEIIPLNLTHFVGIIRSSDASSTWRAETNDAGVTWSFNDVTAELDLLQDPGLNWLNEEEGVIILHGRNRSGNTECITTFWLSVDNGTTWQNETVIQDCGTMPPNDGGYTGFATYPGEHKGFLVWYDGSFTGECDIKGIWISDNASYSSTPSVITPQFISINGSTNGTVVTTSNPVFNWTSVYSATRYWLQIANDSAFSDIVVNISDINDFNYPDDYSENETRISFTLPVFYSLSEYKTYYCRVKAYTM